MIIEGEGISWLVYPSKAVCASYHLVQPDRLAGEENLPQDFPCSEVSEKPHFPSPTELALFGASDLAGYAHS